MANYSTLMLFYVEPYKHPWILAYLYMPSHIEEFASSRTSFHILPNIFINLRLVAVNCSRRMMVGLESIENYASFGGSK